MMNAPGTGRQLFPECLPASGAPHHTDPERRSARSIEEVVPMQAELETPETYARRTILHALRRSPYDVWTKEALASRFGIATSLAGRILAELVGAGLARRLEGADDEYTASGAGY
jgi:hypothetical protein